MEQLGVSFFFCFFSIFFFFALSAIHLLTSVLERKKVFKTLTLKTLNCIYTFFVKSSVFPSSFCFTEKQHIEGSSKIFLSTGFFSFAKSSILFLFWAHAHFSPNHHHHHHRHRHHFSWFSATLFFTRLIFFRLIVSFSPFTTLMVEYYTSKKDFFKFCRRAWFLKRNCRNRNQNQYQIKSHQRKKTFLMYDLFFLLLIFSFFFHSFFFLLLYFIFIY